MKTYNDAFDFTEIGLAEKNFISKLLSRYSLVLAIGLSATGKSTVLGAYENINGYSLTRWDRNLLFSMLRQDGNRVDSHYGLIGKVEQYALPKLLMEDFHQVFVEGWFRMPSARRKVLSYVESGKTCCLVFDGPTKEITERIIEHQSLPNLIDLEIEDFVIKQKQTFVYPSFGEGWTNIYYINTFGEVGNKYLLSTLGTKK